MMTEPHTIVIGTQIMMAVSITERVTNTAHILQMRLAVAVVEAQQEMMGLNLTQMKMTLCPSLPQLAVPQSVAPLSLPLGL